jgi:hypothetical protein
MGCWPSPMGAICFAPALTEPNSPSRIDPEAVCVLFSKPHVYTFYSATKPLLPVCEQRRIASISIRSFEKEPVIFHPTLMKRFAICSQVGHLTYSIKSPKMCALRSRSLVIPRELPAHSRYWSQMTHTRSLETNLYALSPSLFPYGLTESPDPRHLPSRAPAPVAIHLTLILPGTPTQPGKDAMVRPTHSAERQAHPVPDREVRRGCP